MKTITIEDPDDPRLRPEVSARLKVMNEQALKRVAAFRNRVGIRRMQEFAQRLREIVRSSATVAERLEALYQLVDEQMAYTKGVAACRRGCSHCCHVAVAMVRQEAEYIGERIGRTPQAIKGSSDLKAFDWGYHNPCTFLVNGECSIYAHRPLACRGLYNMDIDSLLCELDPPFSHSVPHLDTRMFQFAWTMIVLPEYRSRLADLASRVDAPLGRFYYFVASQGIDVADIREWFPREHPKESADEQHAECPAEHTGVDV